MGGAMPGPADAEAAALAAWLRPVRRLVAFTGAGISTESGIPDFRGPGGLWERHQPVLFDDFLASPEARREYWAQRRLLYPVQLAARPNAAHVALHRLETAGRLRGVVTQNIDGLHQLAGHPAERVLELHGTNTRTRCLGCGALEPAGRTWERLAAGEDELRCPACGGIQKPDTISFGQALDPEVLHQASEWMQRCDGVLVIGSSLVVEPAASLPRLALQAGARLAILNAQPTPLDALADLVLRERASPVLDGAVRLLIE